MKNTLFFGVAILATALMAASAASAAIRINEVEANPAGTNDTGNEWVELFSDEEINLDGWKITTLHNKGKIVNLSGTYPAGYIVVNKSISWIRDSNETVSLWNGDTLVNTILALNDSSNDNKTRQFCSRGWVFAVSTRAAANNCPDESPAEPPAENTTANETYENNTSETAEEDDGVNITAGVPDEGGTQNSAAKNRMVTGNIIYLNPPTDDNAGEKVIYESKNEKIGEYAIYAFAGLLVFIIILLLLKR